MKKKIEIPIFHGYLVIMKVKSWKKINRKFNDSLSKIHCACAFNHISKKGHTMYTVAFKGKPTFEAVSHEVVHIVNRIMIDRRMQDGCNDEAQAYLTGWVVNEISKHIKIK